jgi:hypothetical protein
VMSPGRHPPRMDDVRVGRALRALRRRRSFAAVRLAHRAWSPGHARDPGGAADVRRCGGPRRHGCVGARGALDRLLDARHAAIVETVVRDLRAYGWEVAVEVSFNHYGDRGSIDVLGLHRAAASALVVEVKSELAAIEETVRRLDVKGRLAPGIVEERFRVTPRVVGRLVVLPRSTTAWRRVRSVAATLDAALPDRGSACRRWLRAPAGPMAGVLFVSSTNARSGKSGTS